MESPLLGLILDSSVVIAAERKRQTVEDFLTSIGRTFGEIEIAISAVRGGNAEHPSLRDDSRLTGAHNLNDTDVSMNESQLTKAF
jgi:hypothetical protein